MGANDNSLDKSVLKLSNSQPYDFFVIIFFCLISQIRTNRNFFLLEWTDELRLKSEASSRPPWGWVDSISTWLAYLLLSVLAALWGCEAFCF